MSALISLIPETAPFSDEQRAWLNGFLAGWIGIQDQTTQPGATETDVPTTVPGGAGAVVESGDDGNPPWHDPAIPLDERLRLADGLPLPKRLMAAMAQLDCGSCGYDCRRYADAIASGTEKSLKLCSPGGTPTAKRLKELISEGTGVPTRTEHAATVTAATSRVNGKSVPMPVGWSRRNPFPARLLSVRNLNGQGSSKHTAHVEIDLSGGDLSYVTGDSLGVYPSNCPELVEGIIAALGSSGDEQVSVSNKDSSLRQALRDDLCLTEVTDEFLELLRRTSGTASASVAESYLQNPERIDGRDVLDILNELAPRSLDPAEFTSVLSPLRPRLYSISSAPKGHPGQVHLTVSRVAWTARGRIRKGVASTMFADRLQPGDPIRVFVQEAHGFRVPANPDLPMIMVGPGTGIAPFRAFLQERQLAKATGRNWLFFGDQHSATDFLYAEELQRFHRSGLLTRLDLAFSRDQDEKIYVQHRMMEHGAAIWQWLNERGHLYVCGDARRMAADVDRALRKIISRYGGKDAKATDAFVADLIATRRYCRDIY